MSHHGIEEIGLDAYEYHWFQYGDGGQRGGPRFRADHRVFRLRPSLGDLVDAAVWHAVMQWFVEQGFMPDGWTCPTRDPVTGQPAIAMAIWRFRRHEQVEAELFAHAWIHDRRADIHAVASLTRH